MNEQDVDAIERHAEVLKASREQTRFVFGERSDLAPGGPLSPGDQQYSVTDTETGTVFLIFDHRSVSTKSLTENIRQQLKCAALGMPRPQPRG
jgi:hypothetical protein